MQRLLNIRRLFLQPAQAEDTAEIHAIFAQEGVYRYMTDGVPMPLAELPTSEVITTVISYEEQMRGWMAYIARARSIDV